MWHRSSGGILRLAITCMAPKALETKSAELYFTLSSKVKIQSKSTEDIAERKVSIVTTIFFAKIHPTTEMICRSSTSVVGVCDHRSPCVARSQALSDNGAESQHSTTTILNRMFILMCTSGLFCELIAKQPRTVWTSIHSYHIPETETPNGPFTRRPDRQ